MKQKQKILFLVGVIALIAIGFFYLKPSTNVEINHQGDQEVAQEETQDPSEQEALIKVSLIIGDASYEASVPIASSALDVMQKVSEEQDFSFSGQDSDFGFFVDEIDGVASSTSTNEYWTFYVNDEMAQVGVSQFEVQNGDVIEWKYEKAEF